MKLFGATLDQDQQRDNLWCSDCNAH
jgi:hypothetical protein